MPVKRRLSKGRHALDEHHMEDLFYGPGTCLFGGCGYMAGHNGRWPDLDTAEQEEVLAAMRDDWERHEPLVIAAWGARSPHERQIARDYHGSPVEPWAQREFGEP